MTEKSFEDAVSQLITAEAEIRSREDGEGTISKSAALFANDNRCRFCKKKGHFADQCFFNPDSKNYKPQLAKKRNDRRKSKYESHYKPGKYNASRTNNNQNQRREESAYVDISLWTHLASDASMSGVNKALKGKWYIDSGASAHMCNDPNLFANWTPTEGLAVSVGDGKKADVTGTGNIICKTSTEGKTHTVRFKDVLCVPSLMCNLISVSKVTGAGLNALFSSDRGANMCSIATKKEVFVSGFWNKKNGLYEAILEPMVPSAHTGLIHSVDQHLLWHRKLGHVSSDTIEKSIPLITGVNIGNMKNLPLCKPCKISKSARKPRPSMEVNTRQSTKPLELVHTDLMGPFQNPSLRGSRYVLPLYDDASGLSMVSFLQSKDGTTRALKQMITQLETLYEGKVKRVRSDNGGEFLSQELQSWFLRKGITHERTTPYSPESNGKAERLNRTLLDMARTLLMDAQSMPNHKRLWAEAINVSSYLRNRLYTSAGNVEDKTPLEVITGKKPNLSHVQPFGTKCYSHIPKQRRASKMDARAQEGHRPQRQDRPSHDWVVAIR